MESHANIAKVLDSQYGSEDVLCVLVKDQYLPDWGATSGGNLERSNSLSCRLSGACGGLNGIVEV